MLTYNQELYIKQAIDSVLMQETNFNFQLVIGEDFSTDSTREICETYANRFPNKIKLLKALPENIGLIKNYIRTIKACNGKYIAICDGDDYWIDTYKLQKQVDFLEANPNYAIVGTGLNKIDKNDTIKTAIKHKTKKSFSFEDLILDNFIASVTVMFRNVQMADPLPSWISKFPYGDYPTYLWTIKERGKIFMLNDVTAVYRSDIGISSKIRNTHSDSVLINLNIVKCIASDKNFKQYKACISKSVKKYKIQLISSYNRERKYFKSFLYTLQVMIDYGDVLPLLKFYVYSIKQSIKTNYM